MLAQRKCDGVVANSSTPAIDGISPEIAEVMPKYMRVVNLRKNPPFKTPGGALIELSFPSKAERRSHS